MSFRMKFLGGAGTVTGSKFLLENSNGRTLIDCGLFQGLKELRLQNWAPFPVDPKTINRVILTHAHLDHTGYLPLLVRQGFSGKIHCTPPTRDLAKIILLDSAKIQEEDAQLANVGGYSKHHPAKPLYTVEEARQALALFAPVRERTWVPIDGERFRFQRAGHILGSAMVELETREGVFLFTGDLGRMDPLLLEPPAEIAHADYLITESTYGDRVHPPGSPLRDLARIVNETHERKGYLIIPSFAVGRTQDVLYLLSELREENQIPRIPVFLDSPMGINATEIFASYSDWHRLMPDELNRLASVATLVKSHQQSEELLHRREPCIVIAGSGMMTGGRVLDHLMERLPDSRNTVLLVGYQAAGTRGALLRSGAREIKIRGQYVPVQARIEEISSLSAHADQHEILRWMGKFQRPPKQVFIVHGEPQAADALRAKIENTLNWNVHVPGAMEEITLSS